MISMPRWITESEVAGCCASSKSLGLFHALGQLKNKSATCDRRRWWRYPSAAAYSDQGVNHLICDL